AFILQRFRARLRFFPLSQQALAIGALLVNDRIVVAAVNLALGQPLLPWEYWWAPLLGTALWPPLFLMLDALRLGRRDCGPQHGRLQAEQEPPRRSRAVPAPRRAGLPGRGAGPGWAGGLVFPPAGAAARRLRHPLGSHPHPAAPGGAR